jgi:putative transcriptional regulator
MLIINLKHLITKKSARDRKRIYYKDISNATGIGVSTLSRIAIDHNYNISRDHIEKLCRYFECTPNDLITIIPDPPETDPVPAHSSGLGYDARETVSASPTDN